jgi:hypothetical protein
VGNGSDWSRYGRPPGLSFASFTAYWRTERAAAKTALNSRVISARVPFRLHPNQEVPCLLEFGFLIPYEMLLSG